MRHAIRTQSRAIRRRSRRPGTSFALYQLCQKKSVQQSVQKNHENFCTNHNRYMYRFPTIIGTRKTPVFIGRNACLYQCTNDLLHFPTRGKKKRVILVYKGLIGARASRAVQYKYIYIINIIRGRAVILAARADIRADQRDRAGKVINNPKVINTRPAETTAPNRTANAAERRAAA